MKVPIEQQPMHVDKHEFSKSAPHKRVCQVRERLVAERSNRQVRADACEEGLTSSTPRDEPVPARSRAAALMASSQVKPVSPDLRGWRAQ